MFASLLSWCIPQEEEEISSLFSEPTWPEVCKCGSCRLSIDYDVNEHLCVWHHYPGEIELTTRGLDLELTNKEAKELGLLLLAISEWNENNAKH